MPKWLKFCVALICLICVLAICIAPEVDLPDTVLRARQVILLLLLAVVALASLSSRQAPASSLNIGSVSFETAPCLWLLLEPERKCVFRC